MRALLHILYQYNKEFIVIHVRILPAVPGPITDRPIVVDRGRTWLSLAWSRPTTTTAAPDGSPPPPPVLCYKVESWLRGGEARWTELGRTPLTGYDAFHLKPRAEYRFRVTPRNRHGWGESVACDWVRTDHVTAPPEFQAGLDAPGKLARGKTLRLNCVLKPGSGGGDGCRVSWFKDDEEIGEGMEARRVVGRVGNKCELLVREVGRGDGGRYECRVENGGGRVASYAAVQVVEDERLEEAERRMKTLVFFEV